ncbi:APC family permease [Lentibacillus salinarum]|uniref:APC family permease n=1 Tax=Lentibacillus salinarum TaxID=446820 RepID=A0ABW3ZUN2_9BACI
MNTPITKKEESIKKSPERLEGQIGTAKLVFMVVAAAAPLTVIGGNVSIAILNGNGPGAPIGFLIAMLVMLFFSIGFATMTPYVKEPGAFYAYIRKSLGKRLGLSSAYIALVTYTSIQVGMYAFGGGSITNYFETNFGISLPWWIFSFILVAIVGFFGYRKVELSAKVLSIVLILEMSVVIILDLIIFASGGKEGITSDPISASNLFTGTISVAILFALTGFLGFESTAIYRDETRNPDRVIPRATYIAVFLIGLFYAITTWAFVVGWGPSLVVDKVAENPDGFLIATAAEYAGIIFADIVNLLLLISIFACVLSFHNIITRYQHALALEGDFPKKFSFVHERHRSPSFSSLVQTVTAVIILVPFSLTNIDPLVNIFGSMAGVATIGNMILLFLTSLSVLIFFRSNQDIISSRFKTNIAPITAMTLIFICMGLALANFQLITGLSVTISYILACIPALVFVTGFVMATYTPNRKIGE